MKRRAFLFGSLFALASYKFFEDKDLITQKYQAFKFEKRRENLFVMTGKFTTSSDFVNNNPAFIESKNGVIVIDAGGTYEIGQYILAEIKKHTSKPIIALFNTHNHSDHCFANKAIKECYPNVKVYAHKKFKRSVLKLYKTKPLIDFYTSEDISFTFPNTLLKNEEKLTIDGEIFKISHPKKAHTNCDIAITHLNSNTMFMGDTVLVEGVANFGLDSSILGNIDFLEKILNEKEHALYVVGHGSSGTKEETLLPYLDYLTIIKKEAIDALEKEIDFFALDKVADKIVEIFTWRDEFNYPYTHIRQHLEHLYLELEMLYV